MFLEYRELTTSQTGLRYCGALLPQWWQLSGCRRNYPNHVLLSPFSFGKSSRGGIWTHVFPVMSRVWNLSRHSAIIRAGLLTCSCHFHAPIRRRFLEHWNVPYLSFEMLGKSFTCPTEYPPLKLNQCYLKRNISFFILYKYYTKNFWTLQIFWKYPVWVLIPPNSLERAISEPLE